MKRKGSRTDNQSKKKARTNNSEIRKEDVEDVENVENVENVESVESVENVENVENMENMENMENVENVENNMQDNVGNNVEDEVKKDDNEMDNDVEEKLNNVMGTNVEEKMDYILNTDVKEKMECNLDNSVDNLISNNVEEKMDNEISNVEKEENEACNMKYNLRIKTAKTKMTPEQRQEALEKLMFSDEPGLVMEGTATIPDFCPPTDEMRESIECPEERMWDPSEDIDETMMKVYNSMSKLSIIAHQVPYEVTTTDAIKSTYCMATEQYILDNLHEAGYCIETAVDMMAERELPESIAKRPSEEELISFMNGIVKHGKNFAEIQADKLPRFSTAEVVQMYYNWKWSNQAKELRGTNRFRGLKKRPCSSINDVVERLREQKKLLPAHEELFGREERDADGVRIRRRLRKRVY